MHEILRRVLPAALRNRLYHVWLRFPPVRALRRARLRQRVAVAGTPVRLALGPFSARRGGWISADEQTLDPTNPQEWTRYFKPDSLDAILTEHLWQSMTAEQGRRAAQNCFTRLKPGGYLRLAVPDGYHPDPAYIQRVRGGADGTRVGAPKVLYTYPFLADMLTGVGFRVELLEYFDEDGKFHFRAWDQKDGMIQQSSRFERAQRGAPLDVHLVAGRRMERVKSPEYELTEVKS